jgi:hypothetical protein
MIRHLLSWLFASADDEPTPYGISPKNLRHHLRAECAQGWEGGPRWMSPAEIANLRKRERREARHDIDRRRQQRLHDSKLRAVAR